MRPFKIILLVVSTGLISLSIIFAVQIAYGVYDDKSKQTQTLIEKYETQKYLLKQIRPRLKAIPTDSLILKNLIDGNEELALKNYVDHVERHKRRR